MSLLNPDVHLRLFREREAELILKAQRSQLALTDVVRSRHHRSVRLPRLRTRLRPTGDPRDVGSPTTLTGASDE